MLVSQLWLAVFPSSQFRFFRCVAHLQASPPKKYSRVVPRQHRELRLDSLIYDSQQFIVRYLKHIHTCSQIIMNHQEGSSVILRADQLHA